jgi:outer membrane lipoprotein-sorting protein
MMNLKTLAVNFEYKVVGENGALKETQKGEALFMDNMYKVDLGSSTIYSNGKERWVYLKEVNEVTVYTVNPMEDGLIANPSTIFTIDEKEYSYKKLGETTEGKVTKVEVEFIPKEANAPYNHVKIVMDKATAAPFKIEYSGKDGNNITISISKFDTGAKANVNDFTFNAAKYPASLEMVDMRN